MDTEDTTAKLLLYLYETGYIGSPASRTFPLFKYRILWCSRGKIGIKRETCEQEAERIYRAILGVPHENMLMALPPVTVVIVDGTGRITHIAHKDRLSLLSFGVIPDGWISLDKDGNLFLAKTLKEAYAHIEDAKRKLESKIAN